MFKLSNRNNSNTSNNNSLVSIKDYIILLNHLYDMTKTLI